MTAKPNTFLYYGRNIRVYISRTDKSPSKQVVICFHGRLSQPGFPAENFGEFFFKSRDIDAIHIQTNVNNWYQSPDLAEALAAAAHAVMPYKHRITYGTTMGAYAALAFSRALNATGVIAFMPQYSPVAEKVPFEGRWNADRAAVMPVMDDMDMQISKTAQIYLAYDPLEPADRRHADLIAATGAKVTRVTFPLTNLEVVRFLNDADLVEKFVHDALDGRLNTRLLRSRIRRARRISTVYLFYMGQALLRRGNAEGAWQCFLKAMELPSGHFDHYNRMFLQAKRQVPPAGVAEKIADVVARQTKNLNLLKAFEHNRAYLAQMFVA